MNFTGTKLSVSRDPVDVLLANPDGAVLAVIAGVEGPSYRPLGAMMTVIGEHERAGTLSSGCIEADIAIHAMRARNEARPHMVRYGRGSPFIDIALPCGGGLDILLLPNPDLEVLSRVMAARAARQPCSLQIDLASGTMTVLETGATERTEHKLTIRFEPDLRFLVLGKGPEASTFTALVQSGGYPNILFSPDQETLDIARQAGSETRHLVSKRFPEDVAVDDRTAIVLFFHDHEWEPPLLAGALETPAFYIGAQGSRRARDMRLLELEAMGVPAEKRTRLHGPIGLIPSARNAGTLAVSVLAEVLAIAMPQ